jgi:hypothetical protein
MPGLAANGDRPRQLIPPRVEPNANRIAALSNGFNKCIREMRQS